MKAVAPAFIITTLAVSLSAVSPDAFADSYGKSSKRDYRHEYHDDRNNDRYHDRRGGRHHANRDVVRLDIPVRVRGDDRVHLRRLVRQNYDIDLSQYRLRKVVLGNKARRGAYAKLRVGEYATEPLHLSRGKNHIRAPRHSNGRWILKVQNARLTNIRLVLEPKRGYANNHEYRNYRHGYRHNKHAWFADDPHKWLRSTIKHW